MKNLDWSNIGFEYMQTEQRYVSNYKDGSWDEGGLISNFLTAWEETRTVTFVYDKMLADGNLVTSRVPVEVPATWEVLPRYPEETFCYLNQEQTKEYAYPGDGTEDYTVYVTNVAG